MVDQTERLARLFTLLDTLGTIACQMHPPRLTRLVSMLDHQEEAVRATIQPADSAPDPVQAYLDLSATLALQACALLRDAPASGNPMQQAFRAMRQYSRALEALNALADSVKAVGRYLLEPGMRDDAALLARLDAPPAPDTGVFHAGNQTSDRGGFSVYVPPWYDPARAMPVIMALHGGSGHGRLFLWNWVPEARSRGMIVIAPTAIGSTWSLMEPETDSRNLEAILTRVRDRWSIDAAHMLLTGMSDGGTFTLLSGLSEDSPFTHLAPAAASFHPLLLAMTSPGRLTGLPIHLTHGALDWMFPVDVARTAHRTLAAAGAAITYREIADGSHAYPRDRQGAVLDWFMGTQSGGA
jgi:phospholipase/carboxylesterase